jgi:hypothetical protein
MNLGPETKLEGIRGIPGKLQNSSLKHAQVACLKMLHNLQITILLQFEAICRKESSRYQ